MTHFSHHNDNGPYARTLPLVAVTRRETFLIEPETTGTTGWMGGWQEGCYEDYACGHRDFPPPYGTPATKRRCWRFGPRTHPPSCGEE